MRIEKRYCEKTRDAAGKLRSCCYYSTVSEFDRNMEEIKDCWEPESGTTVTLYDTWAPIDRFGIIYPEVRKVTIA